MADKELSRKVQVDQDNLSLEKGSGHSETLENGKNAKCLKQPQRHNKSPLRHNQRKQTVDSVHTYKRRSTREDACPAIGAEYRNCGNMGHFASVCRPIHVF